MTDQDEEEERRKRIRRMNFDQNEMILKSDIQRVKRKIEDAQMDARVLQKKSNDIKAQIEEAERIVRKAEEELRFKEEELRTLRKKMQSGE